MTTSHLLTAARTEVIRGYLDSAAEEMRRTLIRTAFNPVIYEVLDFGISLFSGDLDLIAEARSLALFLGANDHALRKGLEHLGAQNLERGDIVLMNYPYWNSAHTMDVTLFAPVFAEGADKPFAYTCIRAHWMDLGAKDPGYVLDSTDMHQEGLIMPCLKVHKRGVPDREIYDLIRFNSRMPDLVLGDLEAQIAATRTGERRLMELHAKFGAEAFHRAVHDILAHGEAVARRALAALPHGQWTAEDLVDNDGLSDTPVPIAVTVTLDDDGLRCDFTASSGATRGPINMPFGLTETVCKLVLKALTTPHLPSNGGHFRPLEVIAPPGSLFHAVYPAATFTLWTAHLALELVLKALAQGMPEHVTASSGGDVLGFMMVGHDATGKLYAVSNNDAIGWGAGLTHDGANAVNHVSGSLVRNTPIEVLEMKTGMRVETFELLPDSGGPGCHRGGLGLHRRIRFTQPGEFLSITKKTRTDPWPMAGGDASRPNQVVFFPGTDRERRVGTWRAPVVPGDVVDCVTGGGAGCGPAVTRDPQAVLHDVEEGYVSAEAARTRYGVVLRDGQVDATATAVLRQEMAS
jgi:N-methylhydantoinase B